MLQNKELEKTKIPESSKLDDKIKSDLINSHFRLGSYKNIYKTVFQNDYEPKSQEHDSNFKVNKDIKNSLRSHSYVLGNHKVDYNSENKLRFLSPDSLNNPNKQKKISTNELMKSHYKFGNDDQSWITSSQAYFSPLPSSYNRFEKKFLMKTNINFGNDVIKYGSSNQTSIMNIDLYDKDRLNMGENLRKNYYQIGNGHDMNTEINTIAKKDFIDPKKTKSDIVNKKVDTFHAMDSHFSLGEKFDNYKSTYETVYKSEMIPKESDIYNEVNVNLRGLNVKIAGSHKNDFKTEKQSKYDLKKNEITKKEIEDYKQDVIGYYKGQHWNLGSEKCQLESTTAAYHAYDKNKAKFANIALGDNKKSDLKSVHFNLGYSPYPLTTTHLSVYQPLETQKKIAIDPIAKKTHLEFNPVKRGLENQTIYKSDYVHKEIEE